jgi:hypothetical protein
MRGLITQPVVAERLSAAATQRRPCSRASTRTPQARPRPVAASVDASKPSDRAKEAIASAGEVLPCTREPRPRGGEEALIIPGWCDTQRAARHARAAVKVELERAHREIARLEAEHERLLAGGYDPSEDDAPTDVPDWLLTADAVNALDSLMNELAQVVRPPPWMPISATRSLCGPGSAHGTLVVECGVK